MADDGAQRRQLERRLRREDRADQLRWIAQARCLAATLDLLPQPVVLVPADDASASAIALTIGRALLLGPHHPQRLELTACGSAATASLQVQALDFGASADLPVTQLLLLELHEQAPPERRLQRLRDDFQLTRKEAECAVGLYAIGSIDEFARCAGKSIHTARTQLKAAMLKTGTRTQAGLVALVANLVNG